MNWLARLTSDLGATIIALDAFWSDLKQRGGGYVTKVVVDEGESFDSLLRRFDTKVQSNRVMSEVRRRRFFEKPSIIRKRKKAAKLRKSRRQSNKDLRGHM